MLSIKIMFLQLIGYPLKLNMKIIINLDLDNETDALKYSFLNSIQRYHQFIDEVESCLYQAQVKEHPNCVYLIARVLDELEDIKFRTGVGEIIDQWNKLQNKNEA